MTMLYMIVYIVDGFSLNNANRAHSMCLVWYVRGLKI